jgi:hypothetical protein
MSRRFRPVERHFEEEPERGHRRVDGRWLHTGLGQMQLERAQLFRRRGVGGTAEQSREPLDGTDVLALRVSGTNLRMLMSSSMRWRSGLMGFSLIGGSCLEVGVLDPSILKTQLDTLTRARVFPKLCVTADRRPPLWPRLDQLTLVKIAPASLPLRLAT